MATHVTRTLNLDAEDECPDPKECLAQVERVVCSPGFLGSETLCKLLHYLAHHRFEAPAEHLKEYQIATEVLGRPADFDPQADSCVRVQVGRLRSKLAHYYETDGAQDAILMDVLKGRYVLSFRHRIQPSEPIESEGVPAAASLPVPASDLAPDTRSRRRSVLVALTILVVAFLGAVVAIRVLHETRTPRAVRQSAVAGAPAAFQIFWSPFLRGSDTPFVIFANAEFVGTPEVGMRYFDASKNNRSQATEHYTGIGEVMGVLELDRLFEQKFGRQFRAKPGGLFTLDDALTNNLIFVGSPTENITLTKLPIARDFVFREIPTGPNRGDPMIVDLHPRPGGTGVYRASPPTGTGPLNTDYAVVLLAHGLDQSRWTLVLAGITTVGTQAAVNYVCDKNSLEDLLRRLHVTKAAEMKPFEALLKVMVANDVPLETQLVEVRTVN